MHKCVFAIAEEMQRLVEQHHAELNHGWKAWPRTRGHDEVDKDPEELSLEPASQAPRTQGEPEIQ